ESAVDAGAAPPRPLALHLHCRRGLEAVLVEELGGASGARAVGPGVVSLLLDGPLDRLWRARTFLGFAFPLPPVAIVDGDRAAAVARALAQPAAREVLGAFTKGAPRYRLEWTGAGKRRAEVHRAVEAAAALWPELVNDPSRRAWEAVVRDGPARVEL